MNQIIDKEFHELLQDYNLERETILWEGKPKPPFSITLLEYGGHYDAMTGATSIFGMVLFCLIYSLVLISRNNSGWLGWLMMLVSMSIIIVPEILKHQRKKHTYYAFTENRVILRLWRWGKTMVKDIDYLDMGKITYQVYKNGKGVIHFLPRTPFDFFTHDFGGGTRRHYPTFEMIDDAMKVYEQLETLRKERVRKKALGELS